MKTTEISHKSPKNKYVAQITYNNTLPEVGNCSTVGAMDIETLKERVLSFYGSNIKKCKRGTCSYTGK